MSSVLAKNRLVSQSLSLSIAFITRRGGPNWLRFNSTTLATHINRTVSPMTFYNAASQQPLTREETTSVTWCPCPAPDVMSLRSLRQMITRSRLWRARRAIEEAPKMRNSLLLPAEETNPVSINLTLYEARRIDPARPIGNSVILHRKATCQSSKAQWTSLDTSKLLAIRSGHTQETGAYHNQLHTSTLDFRIRCADQVLITYMISGVHARLGTALFMMTPKTVVGSHRQSIFSSRMMSSSITMPHWDQGINYPRFWMRFWQQFVFSSPPRPSFFALGLHGCGFPWHERHCWGPDTQ